MNDRLRNLREFRQRCLNKQYGKLGYILAWALGVPIPVLLAVYVLRGCN